MATKSSNQSPANILTDVYKKAQEVIDANTVVEFEKFFKNFNPEQPNLPNVYFYTDLPTRAALELVSSGRGFYLILTDFPIANMCTFKVNGLSVVYRGQAHFVIHNSLLPEARVRT